MAACDSLQHMFDPPLVASEPSLSSWDTQLPRTSPSVPRSSSVTELFGELHFEESPVPLPASPPPSNTDVFDTKGDEDERKKKSGFIGPHHRSGGSLQMCTEGLGFESLGDVEDSNGDERTGGVLDHREGDDGGGGYYCFWGARKRGSGPMLRRWRSTVVTRRERVVGGGGGGGGSCFPPPISIVNRPWVSLRGYRCDGRFMLKEVTVPAREFLHASREGGRLRLDFVQGVEDDEDDDNDYEEGDEDEEQEEEAIEDGNEEEGDVGNSL
ncbi:hypothetical protein MLD38_017225 [Melastoma candidum]|uniref:Uncharacterized protein n=1 Tax=Melastoma candidum TaxID=119954 RepID=A0ACB9QPC9_9MYRT|nr:hypothetical protein MLD38_017225 [Melastoma candidum]